MNAEEYILSSSGLGLPEEDDHIHHLGGNPNNNNQAVMNEKVQSLAGSIYEEFESMILRYDTDVVKSLMPLIVNVLESLDLSYTEIQEYEVELELLKEDNEQLVTQYEREKALRKSADSKNIEFEDNFDGERKDLNVKIESLTSIVKMFELKSKNNTEHINRLEEKENEMKREYSKLHDRYTELFKTHIDYMERAKNFLGSEKMEQMHGPVSNGRSHNRMGSALNQLNRSTGPISFGYTELEGPPTLPSLAQNSSSDHHQHPPDVEEGGDKSTNLRNELIGAKTVSNSSGDDESNQKRNPDKAWTNRNDIHQEIIDLEGEQTEDITHDPSIGPETPTSPVKAMGQSQTKVETRTGNTLYQELSFQDADALGDVDEGADITGGWVHPGEFASAERDHDDSSCFSLEDNILLGMGKEVENLISENNELLATKNALNIVKDDLIAKVDELTGEHEILREEIKSLQDVRSRCQTRISELEDEVKKLKEDLEAKSKGSKGEGDEDDIPMAQRKRFTRVEMARVLMERNQYKEKFMELQDAVRWTEVMRATRSENPIDKKSSRMGIWKIFGKLFTTNDRNAEVVGGKPMAPYLRMSTSGSEDIMSDRKTASGDQRNARNELFDGDSLSNTRRNIERKEQYKQVRAHVKKDDGRTHAYGWSLPVNTETSTSASGGDTSGVDGGSGGTVEKISNVSSATGGIPVPVPVYCQPLMKKEPGMKIWCAAGVNLSGGHSPSKEKMPSSSSNSSGLFDTSKVVSEKEAANLSAIQACNTELDQIDRELHPEGGQSESEESNEELSSHIWICTSTHSISKVTVIDANDPVNVIESFHVCSSHLLCIASVPGIKDSDFKYDQEWSEGLVVTRGKDVEGKDEEEGEQSKELDHLATSLSFISVSQSEGESNKNTVEDNKEENQKQEEEKNLEAGNDKNSEEGKEAQENEEDVDAVHRRFIKDASNAKEEEDQDKEEETSEKMNSVLPTMWLGSQSGSIYVHSAVSQWKRCIDSIKLKDSVLCILHLKGRVLVALANGTIAIFHRDPESGEWDLGNYHLLDLGEPRFSIRCMTQVHDRVWCGYRNKVFVIDPVSMAVNHTFDAHPRKESQVRQMACFGDGVWVSIRLDSTLRLYHAHNYQHLQDVDIEPYVSKMLGPAKYGFSYVRITSLLISCHRLWMGTGNGVIISVPFVSMELLCANSSNSSSRNNSVSQSQSAVVKGSSSSEKKLPGGLVRVYNNSGDPSSSGGVISNQKFIPYCSLSQAQLSFHGHRDSVKFFVSVPGNDNLESTSLSPSSSIAGEKMLVVSGGEGYIDFRMDTDIEEYGRADGLSLKDLSHLIIWKAEKRRSPPAT